MPKPRSRKRKGPKSTRAGCLLCKPHKHQAAKDTQDAKRRRDLRADARTRDASAEASAAKGARRGSREAE